MNCQNSGIQELVTTMRSSFFTKDNVVAQFDEKLIGLVVETLVVEFDQQKYEEYISSGSSR